VLAPSDDSELDQRLAALKRAKGATPDNEGVKSKKRAGTAKAAAPKADGRLTGEAAAALALGTQWVCLQDSSRLTA
jgi:hypothetical protein